MINEATLTDSAQRGGQQSAGHVADESRMAIWLPDLRVGEERELARFRLHLVKRRSRLKPRIHSTRMSFGAPAR